MRNILHIATLCLLIAVQSVVVKGEFNSAADSIAGGFRLITSAPQEKVYLHTDKPYYFQGDTIWFKGYLTSAITHKMNSFSRNLYIEVVDRKNKLVTRKLVEQKNGCFIGQIPINIDQQEGDYYIRAYTRYMQNFAPDFMYVQNFQINHVSGKKCNVSLRQDISDGYRTAIISITDAGKMPIKGVDVKCVIGAADSERKYTVKRTDSNGELRLPLPEGNEEVPIEVVIGTGDVKIRKLVVALPADDFHVDFFPEGGALVAGTVQKVAFKGLNSRGLSEEVTGVVLSESGDTMTSFKSVHSGMGSFMLQTLGDDNYKIIVRNNRNIEKKYDLEKASHTNVALSVNQGRGRIRYQLLKSEDYVGNKPAYLIIHVRGQIMAAMPLKDASDIGGQLDCNQLPEGIAHFVIVDEHLVPLSQRLVYVRNEKPAVSVSASGKIEPRKPIKLTIDVLDENNSRLKGNYSLSVTDCYSVELDSMSENMRSYMLLSSDIKGHIENPGFYFMNTDSRTDVCLDNLMLTQGWTRFDISKILKLENRKYEFPFEHGQYLSGKVVNFTGKPVSDNTVVAVIPLLNKTYYAQTDSNGFFELDKMRFPENTTMRVQAAKKKKLSNYELRMDEPQYPSFYNPHPYAFMKSERKNHYINELEKGYTSVNGQRVIQLPEVSVTGTGSKFDNLAQFKWDEDKIEQTKVKNAMELLYHLPGLQITPEGEVIFPNAAGMNGANNDFPSQLSGKKKKAVSAKSLRPKFYLDNRQIEMESLEQIKAEDIENVNLIDPESDRFLSMNAFNDQEDGQLLDELLAEDLDDVEENAEVDLSAYSTREQLTRPTTGRVMLTSKTGNLIIQDGDLRTLTLMPLGYSVAKRFYSPKYEVKEEFAEADVRSTVFWAPVVRTDGTQPVTVEFYASDRADAYNYVIEGITDDGRVCHASGTLR